MWAVSLLAYPKQLTRWWHLYHNVYCVMHSHLNFAKFWPMSSFRMIATFVVFKHILEPSYASLSWREKCSFCVWSCNFLTFITKQTKSSSSYSRVRWLVICIVAAYCSQAIQDALACVTTHACGLTISGDWQGGMSPCRRKYADHPPLSLRDTRTVLYFPYAMHRLRFSSLETNFSSSFGNRRKMLFNTSDFSVFFRSVASISATKKLSFVDSAL